MGTQQLGEEGGPLEIFEFNMAGQPKDLMHERCM